MRRHRIGKLSVILGLLSEAGIALAPTAPARAGSTEPSVLRVPAEIASIQDAVDQAHPGDFVLISAGVYREAVVVRTNIITIRGLDRTGVLLDGEFTRGIGILVQADGVSVENLSVCCNTDKGIVWLGVSGWRGRFLTTYNNGVYRLWALASSGPGILDHVYASGHPDTGIYLGQCNDCGTLITNSLADRNAAGYSGSNTIGVTITHSRFQLNAMGTVPNSLNNGNPPASAVLLADNEVRDKRQREQIFSQS